MPTERISGRRRYRNDLVIGVSETLGFYSYPVCSPKERGITAPSTAVKLQYDSAEWEPAFLRQAREFLFFPLLPREASK